MGASTNSCPQKIVIANVDTVAAPQNRTYVICSRKDAAGISRLIIHIERARNIVIGRAKNFLLSSLLIGHDSGVRPSSDDTR